MLSACLIAVPLVTLIPRLWDKLLQFQQTLLSIFGGELRENLKAPETKHGVVVVAAARMSRMSLFFSLKGYMAFGNWKVNLKNTDSCALNKPVLFVVTFIAPSICSCRSSSGVERLYTVTASRSLKTFFDGV